MALPSSPNTRKEVYLSNIAGQATSLPSEPHTREEEYLDYIAKNGGGGGGTGDGDMKKAIYDDDLAVATAGGIKAYTASAISGKVDKVVGKGLSTNDYDDTAKGIVDGVNSALGDKVSKSNTAGLLKNDGTVDQTSYATAASVNAILDGTDIDSFGDVESALSDKVSKSSTAGLLKNDGTVDTTTYVSDISGKVDKITNPTAEEIVLVNNDGGIVSSSIQFNAMQRKAFNSPINIDGHSASNVEQAINSLNWYKVNLSDFAGQFDSSVSYNVGDYVIYQHDLYKCTTAHTGEWDSTHFTAVILADEVKTLQSEKADIKNVIANTQLIKDTVGWVSKNKAKIAITPREGFTITDNNGVVTISGSNTSESAILIVIGTVTLKAGTYKISGSVGGSYETYGLRISPQGTTTAIVNNYTGINTFTISTDGVYDVKARFAPKPTAYTDVVFSPMVYDADIVDSSFEPYSGTTAFPRDEQRILGANNFLENKLEDTTRGTISVTHNDNDTITLSAGTMQNTNSSLYINRYQTLKAGNYILSGEGGTDKFYVQISIGGDYFNTKNGASLITIPSDDEYDVRLFMTKDIELSSSITIKPMIRLASNPDGTYVPHAMTNRELTVNKQDALTAGTNIAISSANVISTTSTYTMRYTTTEQVVGTWIDSKPVYQKVVDFGALPNSTTKTVAHGITNLDKIIKINAVSYNSSHAGFLINDVQNSVLTPSLEQATRLSYNSTSVVIGCGVDRSSMSTYVILQYTKTTD